MSHSSSIFIFHGAYGHSQENWIPWLKNKLEDRGCVVYVPDFPTPEGQSLQAWFKVFDSYRGEINNDTIFVGHSIAVPFILRILERLGSPIKASFLISGFISSLGNPDFDSINQSFYAEKFDWKKINENCESLYLYHSDTDPYVPMDKALELAQELGVKPIVIPNAGHFNAAAGYTTFQALLNDIESAL